MIPSYPLNVTDLLSRLPVQKVTPRWLNESKVALYMLRLDLTDASVSGNKWFKLAKNISDAQSAGHQQLLSFGGAYSNHIFSFSSACAEAGLSSVAVVRGEELSADSNPMLRAVKDLGTTLIFVDREAYRRKYEQDRLTYYRSQVGEFCLIPEGGSNQAGVSGAEAIGELVMNQATEFDHVMLACGTGATLAGVVRGISGYDNAPMVHGFSSFGMGSVAVGTGWLTKEVELFLKEGQSEGRSSRGFQLHADASLPGYGRLSQELMHFGAEFLEDTGVLLDPVYTLKLMAFVQRWCQQDCLESQKVLCIHTGGLHGWLGYLDEESGGDMPAQLLGTIKQRLLS